ncbi:hypothetical protein Micbo1qcDRAFT_214127 [Microdochium bolleyi]|uniref:Uncharacterized protein n=1 Tax=Microdochium bolleyi TaxID=196109 RepID=A0A136IVA6_9PEZI|nr:hypothetical protein Micbo1qcDRAFT_214127 [Microdochium bolleyi]
MELDKRLCSMLGLERIHIACLFGDGEEIYRLMAAKPTGFDVNKPVQLQSPRKPQNETSWPRGETPLMLAALMGHLDVAQYLVARGARVDQKDNMRYTAADFYCITEASQEHRCFYLEKKLGSEHPDSKNSRLAIKALLACPVRQRFAQEPGDSGSADLIIAKQGRYLAAYGLLGRIHTGHKIDVKKTVGCLRVRNDCNVLLWAKSGFRAKSPKADKDFLDGQALAADARNIIAPLLPSRLQFVFKKDRNDNGNKPGEPEHEGQFRASHAEVQLSTAYVLNLAEATFPGTTHTIQEKIKLLKTATVGADQRMTTLYLSRIPCRECNLYLQALQNLTRIMFAVEPNVGAAQIHSELVRSQLHDFPCELWLSEELEADSLQHGLERTSVGQPATQTGPAFQAKQVGQPLISQSQPAPKRIDPAYQEILDSRIIDLSEHFDSDSDCTIRAVSRPPTRSRLPRSPQITVDLTVLAAEEAAADSPGSVIGRLPTDPFKLSDDDANADDSVTAAVQIGIPRPARTKLDEYVLSRRELSRLRSTSVIVNIPSRQAIFDSQHFIMLNIPKATEASTARNKRAGVPINTISKFGPPPRNQPQARRPRGTSCEGDPDYIPPRPQRPRRRQPGPQAPTPQPAPRSRASSRARSPSVARSLVARRRQIQTKSRKATTKKIIKKARARTSRARKGEDQIEPPTKTFDGKINLEAFHYQKTKA